MDEAGVVKVIVRPYNPVSDEGFIYSSWRNGLYYHTDAKDKGELTPGEFFSKASKRIQKILRHAKVRIACIEDAPNTIVGYSVMSGSHLNWVYVKETFRNRGIGRLVCSLKGIETVTSDTTRIGKVLVHKYRLKLFQEETQDYEGE